MIHRIFITAVLLAAAVGSTYAQGTQFRMKLALTVGSDSDTLVCGISGDGDAGTIVDNTYKLDNSSSGVVEPWMESSAAPDPPAGIATIRAKFQDVPGRPARGYFLRPRDYRGFTSTAQVDTFAFRVYGDAVSGGGVTVSWPTGLGAFADSWKLFLRDFVTGYNQVADMLATTSYVATATGGTREFLVVKAGAKLVTDVRSETTDQPRSFSLHGNYPNPFNPSTTISFSLPEAMRTKLTVYSLLGEELTTVVDQRLEAGSHTVTFHAKGLASGVYLYRLEAGGLTAVKRMVLVR